MPFHSGDDLGDCRAQPTDDAVLFKRHQVARFASGCLDRFHVNWTNGVHAKEADTGAALTKALAYLDRRGDHAAGGNHGDIEACT